MKTVAFYFFYVGNIMCYFCQYLPIFIKNASLALGWVMVGDVYHCDKTVIIQNTILRWWTAAVTNRSSSLRHMMTSSNGNIFRVTGPSCGEFTGHRWIPLTKSSGAELWCCFFICALNKRLSKQGWGWWFETPSRSGDVIVMNIGKSE